VHAPKTVEIETRTVELEEKGVKLRLTVVDTPGFGDGMNSTEWFDLVLFYLLIFLSLIILVGNQYLILLINNFLNIIKLKQVLVLNVNMFKINVFIVVYIFYRQVFVGKFITISFLIIHLLLFQLKVFDRLIEIFFIIFNIKLI